VRTPGFVGGGNPRFNIGKKSNSVCGIFHKNCWTNFMIGVFFRQAQK